MSKPQAFIDSGFSSREEFRIAFLSSPDFKSITLKNLDPSERQNDTKNNKAKRISQAIETGTISNNRVLLEYVKQPRQWLSFKIGQSVNAPKFESPEKLLTEFGSNTWYGPIVASNLSPKWYIRTFTIPYYVKTNIDTGQQFQDNKIRWTVIAEVGKNYLALSWNNFTYTQIVEDENKIVPGQFPFWKSYYIPQCFDELSQSLQGQWQEPNLHGLVLHTLWDKYTTNHNYRWQHLRIRAEASGVALNAHSAGASEIDVRGLQALSRTLAESVVESVGVSGDLKKLERAENAVLRTLVKEWGTKSYEFRLDQNTPSSSTETDEAQNQQTTGLFKAHCYFGLKPESKTQDSLQHLKCYSGYYGGSTNALRFLLKELGLGG
ncbi:hypothetical protein [Spirulina sp. 06S082]|uniref:hypothetical protein n=1 Tax=Spirulina sp. 06S082 TaxID=3110248 RepID=UPI002B1E973E|nr:hypothetical protein [Spirulina sp. 06S082]MEA5468718.1 hypothetical protein [Spirulina sp. 06S082]